MSTNLTVGLKTVLARVLVPTAPGADWPGVGPAPGRTLPSLLPFPREEPVL